MAKRKTTGGGKKKKQKGKGFLDFIKKGVNFLRDNKVISTVASLVPHPAGQAVASGARMFGFGKGKKKGGLGKVII